MSVTLDVVKNVTKVINVNDLVNSGSTGAWELGSTGIVHNNDIGSFAEKNILSLQIGNTYKVTYTISVISCNVQMYLGDTAGTIQTTTGSKVEILTLTGSKRLRFYANKFATISHYKIEELVDTINDTPIDSNDLENTSWTLSFNPILNQWISFHSYLPNNYIQNPTKLLVKNNDSQLKLNSGGDFGVYFDETIKPFIVETIFNEYKLDTKTFDSVRVIMDTSNDGVFTNTFFDKGVVYTENQCSGEIVFDSSNVTRKEKNWNFNKFLDITNNVSQKIFVSDWDSISSSYPIDKVINVSKINTSKPWYQRGRMRDKYLAVRFISNNLDSNKFICKFVLSSFRISQR